MMAGQDHVTPRLLDHVGFVVPDADDAVAFLEAGLGAVELFRAGPLPAGGPGRDPSALIRAMVLLRLGESTLEVMQYELPDQRTEMPRLGDRASFHLAVHTDDVESSLERLYAAGAQPLMPLREMVSADGRLKTQMAYVLAPWGLPIELVNYPKDLAGDLASAMRLLALKP